MLNRRRGPRPFQDRTLHSGYCCSRCRWPATASRSASRSRSPSGWGPTRQCHPWPVTRGHPRRRELRTQRARDAVEPGL